MIGERPARQQNAHTEYDLHLSVAVHRRPRFGRDAVSPLLGIVSEMLAEIIMYSHIETARPSPS